MTRPSPPSRPLLRGTLAIGAILLLVFPSLISESGALPPPASAALRVGPARLPIGLTDLAAVWTGEFAYLFGGYNSTTEPRYHDTVYRYDPATATLTLMQARFPEEHHVTEAFWDARSRPDDGCPHGCAYIFGAGGTNVTDFGLRVYRYDPATDTLRKMGASMNQWDDLRVPLFGYGLAWTGESAYLIGGHSAEDWSADTIVRYDLAEDRFEFLDVKLPEGRNGAVAAWIAPYIYIVEGSLTRLRCGKFECGDMLRFNPSNGEFVRLINRTSGSERYYAKGILVSGNIVTMGGETDRGESAGFTKYDPVRNESGTLNGVPSFSRTAGALVWTGSEAISFGGYDQEGDGTEEIRTVTLIPSRPIDIQARLGVRPGSVRVEWWPLNPATNLNLTAYRLYRGTQEDGSDAALIAEIAPTTPEYLDRHVPFGRHYYWVSGVSDGRFEGPASRPDRAFVAGIPDVPDPWDLLP